MSVSITKQLTLLLVLGVIALACSPSSYEDTATGVVSAGGSAFCPLSSLAGPVNQPGVRVTVYACAGDLCPSGLMKVENTFTGESLVVGTPNLSSEGSGACHSWISHEPVYLSTLDAVDTEDLFPDEDGEDVNSDGILVGQRSRPAVGQMSLRHPTLPCGNPVKAGRCVTRLFDWVLAIRPRRAPSTTPLDDFVKGSVKERTAWDDLYDSAHALAKSGDAVVLSADDLNHVIGTAVRGSRMSVKVLKKNLENAIKRIEQLADTLRDGEHFIDCRGDAHALWTEKFSELPNLKRTAEEIRRKMDWKQFQLTPERRGEIHLLTRTIEEHLAYLNKYLAAR